jgi:hypothetical protein
MSNALIKLSLLIYDLSMLVKYVMEIFDISEMAALI